MLECPCRATVGDDDTDRKTFVVSVMTKEPGTPVITVELLFGTDGTRGEVGWTEEKSDEVSGVL